MSATAGDVVSLRNHSSAGAVLLHPLAGGTQPKGDWTWKVREIGLAPGTAAAVLNHLREDG